MGSNSKAIEKSDEMLDMNPWEHQTESILDQNLNIYGSSSTEGRFSTYDVLGNSTDQTTRGQNSTWL